jgi:cyclohexanone monooxygenase
MSSVSQKPSAPAEADRCDAVVVGAGLAGLYMLYRLRPLGLSVRVFERGDDVGGVWYWNRYPGARTDGQSLWYSYSFSRELQQEWNWSLRYAEQPELLSYINHVADRFDLRSGIEFETEVVSADYDEARNLWTVRTDKGDAVETQFLITAVGCLSATNVPQFPGLDSFKGETYHTSRWPKEGVDVAGKRVGVIGTGSTGVQVIPKLAEQAAHLTVFQRTANYVFPSRNRPWEPEYEREFKANYEQHRAIGRMRPQGWGSDPLPTKSVLEVSAEERNRAFEEAWQFGGFKLMTTFTDILTNLEANEIAGDFVRGKIPEIVKDPDVAELLTPRDYPVGTKRAQMDSGYYETFNRDNVTLVDVKTHPIQEITPAGLRTTQESYDLDIIVFATGFDAMTGALTRMNITGRDGLALAKKWEAGPRTYLGIMTAGFPNMFTITGPGSPSVLSYMVNSIEQHVDFIADAIQHLASNDFIAMEPEPEAEVEWWRHVNEVADQTLHKYANSWYLGANIPGKPRVFMVYVGGAGKYRLKCEEVVSNNYAGFSFRPRPAVDAENWAPEDTASDAGRLVAGEASATVK